MNHRLRAALARIALAGICAGAAALAALPAGASALSVRSGSAWHEWWRAERSPARWTGADSTLTAALSWRPLAPGVEWAEAELAGDAPAWRTRLVVVRIDPRRVTFALQMDLEGRSPHPAWTIDRAPRDAVVALNAGQFVQVMPWGWLVTDGRQRLDPAPGPLSSAIAFDTEGRMRWLPADSLAVPRRDVRTAFQSYPTLLAGDGVVPAPLAAAGRGVDLAHRDARLAAGLARDGRLLLALTRFDALGEGAGAFPIGPTTPEMAAIMGALGAREAVSLDGGLSAQLLLRERATGRVHRWRGWRKVPLALIVRSAGN